ncbi:MAG: Hsp20/alpha crystallin family protein, partial [Burkholderiales bacterium]
MATAKNVTEGASGHTPEAGQQTQQTQQSGAQNETLQGSPQQRAQGQRQQGDQVPVQAQGGAMQSRRQGGLARYSRDPLSSLQQIADEMDQLFDTFFYGTPARNQRQGQQSRTPALWVPDVELQDEGNQLRIDIDLPGVPKEDVRVQLQEGMLVIEGERRDERTEGGEREGFRR